MHPADFAIALVESAPVLVLDVETTGVEIRDTAIGWVIASREHSMYLPVRHTGGGNLFDDPERFEHRLAQAFALRSRLGLRTVGHNLPFDLWYAGRLGVFLDEPLEDTMLNEVLINDDLRAYDLSACCRRHGVTPKADDVLYDTLKRRFKLRQSGRKTMGHFHLLAGNDPLAHEYAAGDGVSTFELWQAQQAILDRDGLRLVWQLECDLIPYLARMRRHGIKVDLDYAEAAHARLTREIDAALLAFPSGFDANRAADVREWMIANGVSHFPRTQKKGQDSFTESFLEDSVPGQAVVALRRLLKTKSTFVEPILERHTIDGRIHPDLVQFATGDYGTHTGRFSCRNPNLQAFPKRRIEVGAVVRPILVPDDGMTFYEADFSQQEPRLYAHYSEEEKLVSGYNATPPVDVHTIAAQHLGLDRDRAKTLGLSIFNGMQAAALSGRLKVPRLEAAIMLQDFLDLFPRIKQFRQHAPQVAEARGYVVTLLGRRAYFTNLQGCYMAVSRIIQGSAADQMKWAMLEAFRFAESQPEELQLLLSIHDSVLFQATPKADLKGFKRALEYTGPPLSLLVPMLLDMKGGRNWGEASYGADYYKQQEAA